MKLNEETIVAFQNLGKAAHNMAEQLTECAAQISMLAGTEFDKTIAAIRDLCIASQLEQSIKTETKKTKWYHKLLWWRKRKC